MDVLSTEQFATVMGINSRGIYLKFENNRLIFLSFDHYRGPLTANLSGDLQLFSNLGLGGRASVSKEEIRFPGAGVYISILNTEIWHPASILETPLKVEDRINLICNFALDVHRQRGAVGLSEMIPMLAGLHPNSTNWDHHLQTISRNINELRNQFAQGDLPSMFKPLRSFLGLGSGLTPSGDDFVMGLLLSLNRWKSILQPGNNLSIFNTKTVEDAYRCTTTLSANLIECATLGLADERLIQTVDFLATGNNHRSDIISGLLSWGNSSGIDALVGMLTAFLPM